MVRHEGMIYVDWIVIKIWMSLCICDEHGYSLMYDYGLWWDLKLILVTKVILNGLSIYSWYMGCQLYIAQVWF